MSQWGACPAPKPAGAGNRVASGKAQTDSRRCVQRRRGTRFPADGVMRAAGHGRSGAPVFTRACAGVQPAQIPDPPSRWEQGDGDLSGLAAALPLFEGGCTRERTGDSLPIQVYQHQEIDMDKQHNGQETGAVDGRALARRNEVKVLRALHRFGWLRTKDLAALVWQPWAAKAEGLPDLAPCRPAASSLRMAQRTMKRMRQQRQVLKATGPDGGPLYALAEAGARDLRELGIDADSGKDLLRTFSSSHYRHRCIANELAIAGIVQGYRISSEREISRGLWPGGEAGISGKKPDALMRSGERWYWLEVERSARNTRDRDMLLRWLVHMRNQVLGKPVAPIAPGAVLARIIFICRPSFKKKLERDLLELGWTWEQLKALIMFETALYSLEDIAFR